MGGLGPERIRVGRWHRAACAALLSGLLALVAALPARAEHDVRSATWIPLTFGLLPGPEARGTEVRLPLRWETEAATPLQGVALRLLFHYRGDGATPWAVLLEDASPGGIVRVNGNVAGAVRVSDESADVFWRRPHLISIDPALLRQGDNELLLLTQYRGGVHGIGAVTVGPADELAAPFDRAWFIAHTAPWIGATLAVVTAVMTGSLWLRRRERLMALLPAAALLWCAYSLSFLTEVVALRWRLPLVVLEYTSFGAIVAATMLLLVGLSGRVSRRDSVLAFGYVGVAPVLLLVLGLSAVPLLDRYWQPGLLVMLLIAIAVSLGAGIARRRVPHPGLIAALVLGAAAGTHDLLMRLGLWVDWNVAWLPLAGPLVLLALSAPLLDRIMTGLDEAELAKLELEERVREREQLLKRNYERLRDSERAQAQSQERQRIMQDMHDGLGSQLLSSLMLVERGAMSQQQVAQVLRESIDDMRLAIDAMDSDDGMLSALGNLRFRMEPRMRAAGIELIWDARGLPEEIDIDPEAVLPLLRIVQEALQNTIKHSRARAVSVLIRLRDEELGPVFTVRISDNGRGISDEAVGGRGLMNMRRRAGRIGAELKLTTVPGAGTMIQIRYVLKPVTSTQMQLGDSQASLNTQSVIERVRRQ